MKTNRAPIFKFQSNKRYRHNRSLDTDIFVHKIFYVTNETVKFRGAFIDRSTPFFVYQIGTYEVKLSDLDNWTEVKD